MTILALLSLPLSILGWTALATVVPAGLAGIANTGPHGFSGILYAYTEGTGNNGSAFAGAFGQHALLQHDDRVRDADWAVHYGHPAARGRRITGREETPRSVRRYLSD